MAWSGLCTSGAVRKLESQVEPDLTSVLDEHGAVDERIERWLAAQRWRRRVERVLAPLTLTQWLVLDALARMIRESGDAVSQMQVARRLEMNKTCVCQAMQRLDAMGLVDRGPEFESSAYRVYLTEAGENAVRQARLRVDDRSPGWSARDARED